MIKDCDMGDHFRLSGGPSVHTRTLRRGCEAGVRQRAMMEVGVDQKDAS